MLFILGIALFGFIHISCDCDEEFLDENEADIVIEGKVIAIEEVGDDLLKVYITTEDELVEILTPNDEYLCAYPFLKGEDYIVFGYYNEVDNFYGDEGSYYTTICSYTMSTEEWETIMEY